MTRLTRETKLTRESKLTRETKLTRLSEIAFWLGAEPPATEAEIARVGTPADATDDCLVFATDEQSLAAAIHSNAAAVIAPLSLREPQQKSQQESQEQSERESRRESQQKSQRESQEQSERESQQESQRESQEQSERELQQASQHNALPQKPILWVRDPKLAFARAAQKLTPMRAPAGTHPTAVVAQPERVGEGTSIGPYCVIAPGVTLGPRCQILPHVTIYPGVTLGANCVVQSGAVLGATGFGYVRDPDSGEYLLFPQQGSLIIEDDVEIGANTTIDRGALGETRIGRGTKIDNLVHIGHNCRIGRNVIIAAQVGISGSCVVEDGAMLAGQVGLGDHCQVGPGVILGGQGGVFPGKTVKGPGQVFAGTPAEPVLEYLKSMARVRRLK